MMQRSSSLPRPGTIEKIRKLFSGAGRIVGEEERLVRKQVQALTRACSVDKLTHEASNLTIIESIRRVQSADELLSPLSFESFSPTIHNCGYIDTEQQHTRPNSPQSPALQAIETEQGGDVIEIKESRKNSLCLIQLDGLLEEMTLVAPRKLSNQLSDLYRRISTLSTISQSCRDRLPSPLRPFSRPKETLQDLKEKYKDIREASRGSSITSEQPPVVRDLFDELDRIIDGIEDVPTEEDPLNELLLGDETEVVAMPTVERSQASIMIRDLSHELVKKSRSLDAVTFGMTERVVETRETISSVTCAIPPQSVVHLKRPEFHNYSLGELHDNSLHREQYPMTELAVEPLIRRIHENHKICMRQTSTALSLTLAELDEVIKKYSPAIDMNKRSADPKSIMMIPVNDASVPRWIYPGARVKVGRNSPWLQAKSLVVSRNHCELFHDIDCFYVVDVGSTSGTFLNGCRQSEPGEKSGQPALLQSGDILQLGIDYEGEADDLGRIDLRFTSVQLLVLIGYNRRATVPTQYEVEDVTEMKAPRPQLGKLLSWKAIMDITGKIQAIPRRLEGSNVRLWIEHGDVLHSDASGMSVVFYKDRPAFTAVCNNFKMNWEVAMTDASGENVLLLDLLPGSATSYSLMNGQADLGRLKVITADRIVIDPTNGTFKGAALAPKLSPFAASLDMQEVPSVNDGPSPSPFYTITVDPEEGKMYFIQRFHTNRKQLLLGEALFYRTKKRMFRPPRHILEARITLPVKHESLVVLGMLFAALLQLEITL